MAVTKIHPIKSTLKKALDYIENPEKTEDKMLVSSFGCSYETADIEFEMLLAQAMQKGNNLAHHLIQSFAPGEATPEQAHEIGRRLADEVLQGKYPYVLTTHIDKGHVHNHIIFCAVDMVNCRKYISNKQSYSFIRRTSDRLCREQGLSVVKPGRDRGQSYAEWDAQRRFRRLNRVSDDVPVTVLRDGAMQRVPRRDVVVGDVVVIESGETVPADGQLVEAVSLKVNESSLTGEPETDKTADPAHFDPEATYPSDRVLRGTTVADGYGRFVVTAVGDATEAGRVTEQAAILCDEPTPLNRQLARLSRLIGRVGISLAVAIFCIMLLKAFFFLPCMALPEFRPQKPPKKRKRKKTKRNRIDCACGLYEHTVCCVHCALCRSDYQYTSVPDPLLLREGNVRAPRA